MGDTLKDLTGKQYGAWTVLQRAPNRKKAVMWLCKCKCGEIKEVHGTSLKTGASVSCRKCSAKQPRTHGLTHHHLYKVWQRMKGCTSSPNHQDYKHYGGRGITICKPWSDDFLEFYKWANENGYRKGLTIERVNVNGHYEPENCTWIPQSEQPKNRRKNSTPEVGGKI